MAYRAAKIMCWIDIEADGLPQEGEGIVDFRNVNLLEFAMILTDMDLNILETGGYTEVVKMNDKIAANLRATPEVLEMHTKNNLIKDSIQTATMTAEEIDIEVGKILAETGVEQKEVAIAGSGVAMYDFPFVKSKMPVLNSWLAYFPYDFGIQRRISKALAGRSIVNYAPHSYGADKTHRAMDDVEAHLREAQQHRDFYRRLVESGNV